MVVRGGFQRHALYRSPPGRIELCLLFAEEIGLVGLGFFLLVMRVFFAYAWRAWRRMERDSDLEPVLFGLAEAFAGRDGRGPGRSLFL